MHVSTEWYESIEFKVKDILSVSKSDRNFPEGQRGGIAQQHFSWVEWHVLNYINRDKCLMNSKKFDMDGFK